MKVQHTATLDFTDNGTFETGWRIKQGDYGNTELVLKLVNNGVNVYDAAITPQIAFRRWDGASVISVMTPNDQTYKYAFAGNELEVPGLTLCDVKFTDAEGRVSTASCRFTVVEDTIGYDPTGAHTYDNPVSELVEQATNAAEVGIESSFKSEGFAVGEQGGVPVEEGSPYYHNNAKWWAQNAGDPIGTAVEEQITTTGQFTTKTGSKLESCIVAFEPKQSGSGTPSPSNVRPITGHSSVEVWEHGKNFIPTDGFVQGVLSWNDSSDTITAAYNYITSPYIKIKNNTPIEISANKGQIVRIYITDENHNKLYFRGNSPTEGNHVTIPSTLNSYYLRFSIGIEGTTVVPSSYGDIVRAQAEYNNQATAYEPYQGQDITINLGGTYYGGTLDVVSGVLTVTHGYKDMGSLTWTTPSATNQYFQTSISDMVDTYTTDTSNGHFMCSNYDYAKIIGSNTNEGMCLSNSYLRVRDNDYATATAFTTAMSGVQFVYELATPLTIQLTPTQINTLIGENHLDVPLEGQSLTSAVYRELFAWSDVEDVVELRLPISAIGTDESNNDNASQAYSQGDYFYKNGIAKAKTNIASGATFTLGTNYEIKTLAEILKALES